MMMVFWADEALVAGCSPESYRLCLRGGSYVAHGPSTVTDLSRWRGGWMWISELTS